MERGVGRETKKKREKKKKGFFENLFSSCEIKL